MAQCYKNASLTLKNHSVNTLITQRFTKTHGETQRPIVCCDYYSEGDTTEESINVFETLQLWNSETITTNTTISLRDTQRFKNTRPFRFLKHEGSF
ncbi:hypothetical protein VQ01_09975 [Tamlana sp. s12]|nr:hypothetical protein VQ01_09975 [Tamlana sp. s12]